MTVCKHNHRYEATFRDLPVDQGGVGRHKCAGCAYELGRTRSLLDFESLPVSQAGEVRHKSPYAAWVLGHLHG